MENPEDVLMSVPEPPPINEGENVPEHLIEWLRKNMGTEAEDCIHGIHERDNFGFQKYGQHLMTGDGRNDIEDLRQEILDALQYAMKAKMNKKSLKPIMPYLRALNTLVKESCNAETNPLSPRKEKFKQPDFSTCPFCKAKYKRGEKLADHVAKKHQYKTLNQNWYSPSSEDKEYFRISLCTYIKTIYSVKTIRHDYLLRVIESYMESGGECTNEDFFEEWAFVQASRNLLPQIAAPTQPDLVRIVNNHVIFCNRIIETGVLEKIRTSVECIEMVQKEFQCFLNLGLPWDGTNFCPSMIIDLQWHACMQRPDLYKKLCDKSVGKLIPHCLEENEPKHDERHRYFQLVYKEKFRRNILKIADLLEYQSEKVEDAFRDIATILECERIYKEQEDERRRREYDLHIEEENRKREEYFKQHGRYPVNQRSQWDDGKC